MKKRPVMKISTNGFIEDDLMKDKYRLVSRNEMDQFRELFKK
jgi:hypothetical protein